jgi:5-methyltetrahydrofolate--homocysteine methyltransferase
MEFVAIFGFNSSMHECSALQEAIIKGDAAGLHDKVKIMVGGAPVTKGYADAIGADGYGETAAASVELACRLAGEKQEGS